MNCLSDFEMGMAVEKLLNGQTIRDVAEAMNCSKSALGRLWFQYRQGRRDFSRPRRAGGNRCTTVEQDLIILSAATGDPYRAVAAARGAVWAEHAITVGACTVRRRLREVGVRARRPYAGLILSGEHRSRRLQFAREHIRWNRQAWSRCLFTDESRFHLSWNDGRERVYRVDGERLLPQHVSQYDRYGGGSVMVWAGISAAGRTDIQFVENGSMNARRYIDEVLAAHVVPYAGAIGDGFLLMHDNARPHTAKVTVDYLEQMCIDVMQWPAMSPDLNPIEHLWDIIGRALRSPLYSPTTVEELRCSIAAIWFSIPQQRIKTLIYSMRRRCLAAIQNDGGHTQY